jgi:hypothetical protein
MFPPTLHARQGVFVRFITPCDHFFQMAVLRFYNVISLVPMEWGITRSTHLLTCHCFHICHLLLAVYRRHSSCVSVTGASRFLIGLVTDMREPRAGASTSSGCAYSNRLVSGRSSVQP